MSLPIVPTRSNEKLPAVITAEFLSVLRSYDVVEAWIFGSMATGTYRADSDIDLLVSFRKPTTLFTQIDLSEELEHLTGHRIDLMTAIHPIFEPLIRPTCIPLPL